MSALKAGDMAMLVWACCAGGRKHIGWVGVVEEIGNYQESHCYCDYKTHGLHAWITIGGRGAVPVSWLKKIEPPPEKVDEERHEEMAA